MGIFEDKVKKYAPRLMKDFQIKDFHAAGIFGNIGTETGGFKYMQEIKPVVKGSRGGFGWSQWTGPRRRQFEAWAKEKKLDVSEDETNYLFLVHETLTDEWKSLSQLRKTTTLEAATETWMLLNLRPGVKHLKSRLEWARKAADALKSTESTKVAPVTKATVGASTGLVGGALIYHQWEQIMNYWPWFAGMGAAAVIALIIYFIRNRK